ncbi:MAG: DNA replication/repair protein RecF [Candidatus Cloacimonetes bacterium]|nr:DNA replication/repair protein RecF [Candidatus Cloacimonadota bacterium]
MYITSLSLVNYRNFERFTYSFDARGCLITGENGSGKSNLLEAISINAFGKSVRSKPDNDLIQFNKDYFYIQSGFIKEGEAFSFDIGYQNNHKSIKMNKVPMLKLSELYRHIKIVYLAPEDVNLISGSPRLRRGFLDTAKSQTDWQYLLNLREFNQLLIQRNALLKTDYDSTHKRSWDLKFYTCGKEIILMRLNFIKEFEQIFQRKYREITSKPEEISFHYKSTIPLNLNKKELDEFLFEKETKEKDSEHSLFGPHLDDLQIKINGKSAKEFASQGQKRSIVIAIKLAQAEIIYLKSSDYPILMFDDILSELDEERTRNIIHNISKKHQIFIATPNAEHYKDFDLPLLTLNGVKQLET